MQIHELNNFTGTLGSGAYLAIDDGTDTGKISSQGLLAATEARIDNIIAGPAPSAQEVTDARLGADGVVYPSLGDAIRDQVTDLKSDINDVDDAVFNNAEISGTKVSSMGYYQGVLVSTSGWTDGDKYSVRYYPIERGKMYSVKCHVHSWYAFSNYTPSQSLEMEHADLDVASGTFTFVNSDNYKYLYVIDTSPSYPTELPIVVTDKTSKFVEQDKKFIIAQTRVIVAASNAPSSDKAIADFVCDGTNDEVEIQAALNKIVDLTGGEVLLTAGDFYIDSFSTVNGKKIALCLSNGSYTWQKAIVGAGNYPADYGRTKITVTATALSSLGSDVGYVFGTAGFVYGRIGIFKNFGLYLADNPHKVTVIDNTQLTAGMCEKVAVHGVLQNIANTSNTPMPDEDCIGITGYCGDDNGTLNIMKNCFATGFYEGFRLGGEHLVCTQLNARYNYYGYTFGNYDWHTGTQSHPITLINCCDEHSAKLPKFVRNGNYDANDHKAMQEVDLIGFNLELFAPDNFGGGLVAPAQEAVADSFCGRIEFTGYGTSNVDADLTEYPITTNQKRIKFWADGSGHNFRTHNMVHKIGGTTSERQNYTPTYMQDYYDTDLKKKLIFDGTDWVDVNGNTVI